MKHLKRYAALCMALVVACSALAVPASATEYTGQDTFWNWAYEHDWFLGKAIIGYTAGSVCTVSSDTFHHASTYQKDNGDGYYLCICEECGQEFKAYASDLQTSYENLSGFQNVSSEGVLTGYNDFTYSWTAEILLEYSTYGTLSASSDAFTYTSTKSVDAEVIKVYVYFSVPADCNILLSGRLSCFHSCTDYSLTACHYYTVFEQFNGTEWVNVGNSNQTGTAQFVKGVKYRASYYIDPCIDNKVGSSETYVPLCSLYVKSWTDDPNTYLPSINTRVSSVSNDIGILNNGNIDNSSTSTIVDENNLTYYNPVTNTTTNIQNWSYDYSDRSYTVLTDSNNTTTITYGDEYITINEGDNITYNIYYYTAPDSSGDGDSSGSDGSGDDDGGGLLDKIGELIGSVLGGFIDVIGAALGKVIDSLIDLVTLTIEKLVNVINLFGSFGDALGVLWSWLPEEVVTVLVSGVTVIVFASVIKLFMR